MRFDRRKELYSNFALSSCFCSQLRTHSFILGTPQFTTLEEQPESENRFPETAAFRLARNRWHLAVMLMRNPSLTRYRKQHNYNHEEELINKHDEELVRDIV